MRKCVSAWVLIGRFVVTAWEVAGEYIYTTPGDLDSDYMMLTLTIPGYRWAVRHNKPNNTLGFSSL